MRRFRRSSSCRASYGDEGQDVVISRHLRATIPSRNSPHASQMKMNYPVLVGNGRDDVQDAFGPLWAFL